MKKTPRILISVNETTQKGVDRLCQTFPDAEVRLGPFIYDVDDKMPADLMRGVDVYFCELPPRNFEDFDQLKWIQLTSAGYAQVYGLPIIERGIRVTNGTGNFDVVIAEWNILMILTWQRNMPGMLANQKNCLYQRRGDFQRQFRGSTIGFFGYGGIARETARIAKAMGAGVWAMEPDGKAHPRRDKYLIPGTGDPQGLLPDRMFSPDQFEEFMPHLDYLVIGAPLTKTTRGIIGAKELNLLKPSAVVINSARAAIIQEQPLMHCLREGSIRGASIDALYNEPLPPESPWWSVDNTIITSHIAGDDLTTRFTEGIFGLFAENLKRYLAGKTLLNELTTEQLQGN